jgi:cytochrome c556
MVTDTHAGFGRILAALLAPVLLTVLVCVGPSTVGAQPSDSVGEPAWTGANRPSDVVAARQVLMLEIGRLMRPVDAVAADDREPVSDDLRSQAESIEHLLQAVPHLFPPSTNLYDEHDDPPPTAALPAIWQSFPQFYAANEAAILSARALSTAAANDARAAAAALRASCDGCHAVYVKAYTPPTISDEDRDFDFDSLFE